MKAFLTGAIAIFNALHVSAQSAALYGYSTSDCSDVTVYEIEPNVCSGLDRERYWTPRDYSGGHYYFYDNDGCNTDHLYAQCGDIIGDVSCKHIDCITSTSGAGPATVIYVPA